jgi:hypothetical protein
VDRRLRPDVEDFGVEPAWDVALHSAPEHDRDLVRPPEREPVGERMLKTRRDPGLSNTRVSEISSWREAGCEPYRRRRSSTVNRDGSVAHLRSKNACTSTAWRLAQISASADSSSQAANPLSSALNAITCWAACALGPLTN